MWGKEEDFFFYCGGAPPTVLSQKIPNNVASCFKNALIGSIIKSDVYARISTECVFLINQNVYQHTAEIMFMLKYKYW